MFDFKEDYNQGLVPRSTLFFSTSAPFYHQAKKMRILLQCLFLTPLHYACSSLKILSPQG